LRRRGGLSQHDLVEKQLELGGVELFAARSEEALLESGDDPLLAGEFGLEPGVLRLLLRDAGDLAFERLDPGEEHRDVGWRVGFH
jgi:hypothetical protein